MKKIKDWNWWKVGAWTAATAVLCGALVYYNFFEKEKIGVLLLEECPDFELDCVYAVQDGKMVIDEEKTFKLSEHAGDVIVLNFWATYCQPCKVEIPHFNELYETYHDQGLEVVILNGEMDKTAQGLLDEYINYDNPDKKGDFDDYEKYYQHWKTFSCTFGRFEEDNNILDMFEVSSMLPVTIIISREGIIKYMAAAPLTYEELETLILPELVVAE